MNAFSEGNALRDAISGGYDGKSIPHVIIQHAPSRPVARFWPVAKNSNGPSASPERSAFKQALIATLEGKVEGAISPYLFYDPPEFSNASDVNYKSAWGSTNNVPYGAPGWDAHIRDSTSENTSRAKQNHYGFAEGDEEVIATALQEGLIHTLPKRITYYSYGPGELIAVRRKDFQLLDAISESPAHILEALNAIDINARYASTFAEAAHRRYNKEASAIQGDFMEGTLNLGGKIGTSLIGIFGGPFANAPNIPGFVDAKRKAAEYLAQLVSQHGEAARFINTIDTQSDSELLLEDYKPTRHFEAFILGAFPRAVREGIITNENYDVFNKWKLTREFDKSQRAIKLIAEAKTTHLLHTEDKDFSIKKGDGLVFTLSHKWSEQEWTGIYNAAGLDDINFYGKGTRKLVIARATARDPDFSLII